MKMEVHLRVARRLTLLVHHTNQSLDTLTPSATRSRSHLRPVVIHPQANPTKERLRLSHQASTKYCRTSSRAYSALRRQTGSWCLCYCMHDVFVCICMSTGMCAREADLPYNCAPCKLLYVSTLAPNSIFFLERSCRTMLNPRRAICRS